MVAEQDENPFENRPKEVEGTAYADAPFENVPARGTAQSYEELPVLSEEFDKSKLSLVSGFGFVILAVLLYFLLIARWDLTLGILTIASMIVAGLVSLFYLLDDLTFAPASVTERGARFLAGIAIGALLLLGVVTMALNYPLESLDNWLNLITVYGAAVITNMSVTTFLYTMMWEE